MKLTLLKTFKSLLKDLEIQKDKYKYNLVKKQIKYYKRIK